jgi:flagellar biosynthesis/type III secretory pathway M-ring protein FliF/YscJ
VGYEKRRGDKIIIQAVPFHLAAPIASPVKPEQKRSVFSSLIFWIIILMGVAALLFWLFNKFKGRIGQSLITEPEAAPFEAAPEAPPVAPVRGRGQTLERLRQQAESDPEKIAELLKNWLSE